MTNGSGYLGLESRIAITVQSASIFSKPGRVSVREGTRQWPKYSMRIITASSCPGLGYGQSKIPPSQHAAFPSCSILCLLAEYGGLRGVLRAYESLEVNVRSGQASSSQGIKPQMEFPQDVVEMERV